MMKKSLMALVLFFTLGLTSCFDVFTDLAVKDDGSGVLSTKVDMSSMMAMISGMGGMGEEKMKMDTSFVMGSLVDSAEALTAEEKEILRKASIEMNMDSESGTMVFNLHVPFKNLAEVEKIRLAMEKADLVGKSLSKLGKEGAAEEGEDEANPLLGQMSTDGKEQGPGLPTPEEYFTYHFEDGKISRKQIPEKIAVLANDELMGKMNEAIGQGLPAMRMVYTVKLPRPVKKAEGKNVVVSDDKKTITIENTLDELFDDPTKFEFLIEF